MRKKSAQNQKSKKNIHLLRKIILAILLFVLSFTLFFAASIFNLDAWHEFDADKILSTEKSLIVYDSMGAEACVLHKTQDRIEVSLSDLPNIVKYAFISAEDARFYGHVGIDLIRIAGAALADLKSGSYVQGASTITQQLIKLSHLNSEKTMTRKVEEAILAYTMEKQFEKDQILEMYLNYVYFGGGLYGIEAAARGYFGIHAKELDASQAALLAGILKSPTKYAPHLHLDNAVSRRNLILGLMRDYGYLSETQYADECAKSANIVYKSNSKVEHGYYIEVVLQEACGILDITSDKLLTGGYRVYTAMDAEIQSKCEKIISDPVNYPDDNVQGALAVVIPKTSFVCALVGGRDGAESNGFNRAVSIRRQPGSIIKPLIVYAPALEHYGYTASTMIVDEAVDYSGYAPKNFDGKYNGPVTLRKAITSSLNIPAVKVLHDIGVNAGIKFAKSVGIEFDPNDNSLALALGGFTYGVSPLQVANAYAVFANEGYYSSTSTITQITDSHGNVLYSPTKTKTRVMSESNAFILTSMLQSVIGEGTGKRLGTLNLGLAGKTGTAGETGGDGNRDAWCAAYNNEYSATAWIGYDSAKDGRSLPSDATGGSYTALILKSLYSYLYEKRQAPEFKVPDTVVKLRMDKYSLEHDSVPALATAYTPGDKVYYEYFVSGTQPNNTSQFWDLPQAPVDLKCTLTVENCPFITFTAKDADTCYRLYREDKNGRVTLLAEFSGTSFAYFKDDTAPIGLELFYYVTPVSTAPTTSSELLMGAPSAKVMIYIESINDAA